MRRRCGHGSRKICFFSSRRRHTRWNCDWSSDVCSSDLRFSAREKREAAAKLFDEALELWKKAFSYAGHEVDLLERWNSLHLWRVRLAYQERMRMLWEKGTKEPNITTRIKIAYEAFNEFRDERLVKEYEGWQNKYNGDIFLCVLLDTAFAESPPARRKALIEAWLDFRERLNNPAFNVNRLRGCGLTKKIAGRVISYRNTKNTRKIENIGELLALSTMDDSNRVIKFLLNIIPTDEMLEKSRDKFYLLQKKELLPTTATQEELIWIRLEAMLKAAEEKTLDAGERSYDYTGAQMLAGYVEGVYRYNALLFISMGHPQGAKEQYERAVSFYREMRVKFGGYYPFEFQLQIVDIYNEMGGRFKSSEFYQNAVGALEDLLNKERREKIFIDPRNFVAMETAVILNKERLERKKSDIERLISSLQEANKAGNLLGWSSSAIDSCPLFVNSPALKDAMDSLPDYAKSLIKALLIQFNRIEPGIYVKFYHDDEHGLMHGLATVNKALGIVEREYARVEIGPDFYVVISAALLHDADTQNRSTHHIDSAKLGDGSVYSANSLEHKEGNKASDASSSVELREMLLQRGWNLSENESFNKEPVIFHNSSFYHQDFSVAENGHEYDKKKVILYSQVSALFVCRQNEAELKEIITTGCINCVGVSLISPLADGLAAFYLSHFFKIG